MGSSYLNITFRPVGLFRVLSYAIIPGMWAWLGIVAGGFLPSPKKPGYTSLVFLALCALWTLCFPPSSPSAVNGGISSPQSMTSLQTCMALEQNVMRSYSRQGCSRTEERAGEVYWTFYYCGVQGGIHAWAFFRGAMSAGERDCLSAKLTCGLPTGDTMNVYVFRRRYGRERCE